MKLSDLGAGLAAALLLLGIGLSSTAQNGTMSPYSRYGYGILRDRATSTQRSMGGVGYAMQSGRQINAMNPASYAAIDSLTFLFDMGVDVTALWQSETTDGGEKLSDNNFGGGLDYVTMQFPLGKHMGMSVGLVPFSSVGYSFGDEISNGIASRQGSGSINELYAGIAGNIFRGFYVGVDFSYMFGSLLNDSYAIVSSSGSQAVFQKELRVRDWNMTAGLQYGFRTASRQYMTFGLTYRPSKSFLGEAKTYYYVENLTSPEVEDEHKLHHNYTMPETWGAGVNYRIDTRWMFEGDFTYQPWSKAKFRGFATDQISHEFANRWKGAAGVQYVPNYRGGYGKRMNYRLGAYYSRDYLIVRGNNVREFGISAGLGFPVPTFKTTVNLGLEWKRREAYPQTLIREDYLNITLGINFNEMWFRQSKIY
ncbi:MAG: hypothetical protein K2M06_03885 [Muribaculaceae bacterium]|nr:hypothetical protein [Muribaculaceae bacterium]